MRTLTHSHSHGHTHTHIHFPIGSWENDNIKAHRSSRPLTSDPWRSTTACAGGGGGRDGGMEG